MFKNNGPDFTNTSYSSTPNGYMIPVQQPNGLFQPVPVIIHGTGKSSTQSTILMGNNNDVLEAIKIQQWTDTWPKGHGLLAMPNPLLLLPQQQPSTSNTQSQPDSPH